MTNYVVASCKMHWILCCSRNVEMCRWIETSQSVQNLSWKSDSRPSIGRMSMTVHHTTELNHKTLIKVPCCHVILQGDCGEI